LGIVDDSSSIVTVPIGLFIGVSWAVAPGAAGAVAAGGIGEAGGAGAGAAAIGVDACGDGADVAEGRSPHAAISVPITSESAIFVTFMGASVCDG
jgi:hypothetical protein